MCIVRHLSGLVLAAVLRYEPLTFIQGCLRNHSWIMSRLGLLCVSCLQASLITVCYSAYPTIMTLLSGPSIYCYTYSSVVALNTVLSLLCMQI
jgi:hypothetical protein